jgi:hypothetical protein
MFTIPMVPLLNGPTTFIVSEIWNNPFWGVITPVYTHTRNGFVQKWGHIIAPNSKFKTEIWGAKPLDSHFIFEPWTSFLRLFNMFVPWFYHFFWMPIVTGQERCAEKQWPCTNTTRSSSDLADWDKATSNVAVKTFQNPYGYTGFLKWGYPKSPWVSMLKWSNDLDDLG